MEGQAALQLFVGHELKKPTEDGCSASRGVQCWLVCPHYLAPAGPQSAGTSCKFKAILEECTEGWALYSCSAADVHNHEIVERQEPGSPLAAGQLLAVMEMPSPPPQTRAQTQQAASQRQQEYDELDAQLKLAAEKCQELSARRTSEAYPEASQRMAEAAAKVEELRDAAAGDCFVFRCASSPKDKDVEPVSPTVPIERSSPVRFRSRDTPRHLDILATSRDILATLSRSFAISLRHPVT